MSSRAVPALALGLLLTVAAATGAPPESGEAPFSTVVLDNGLTLLLAPSEAHPVVALAMFVTTGGRTEDVYFQGSLHYIEHLVFKGGTPNLGPTEFRKRMSLLGQESGGWTWDDEINFGFQVPKAAFPEALGVFREALFDLQFEEEWFEDEKKVVLQEMERGQERPSHMLYDAWDALAFTTHPYGREVIGTEKAINELELERTERYYRDRFSPNHIVLSIAGDFEIDEMVGWIGAAMGGMARGPESFELGLVEPAQRGPRSREEFVPQATTGLLLTGVVGPPGSHPDTPALTLLAALLENATYGLPQYLEEQEKWVADVSVSHYAMRDASTLQVEAQLDPENLAAVRSFVQRFLLDFDATAVPAEVFEEVRDSVLLAEAQSRETFAEAAARHGFLVSRLGPEGALGYVDRLAATTPAEVQSAGARWLGERRWVTSAVFPDGFDPATATTRAVGRQPPAAVARPELAVAGALLPAAAPPLGYREVAARDGVHHYRFENGLQLVVRAADASSLVAVSGRMLGGQWVEPPAQAGINRLTAEMGMRRTRRWNREGFHRLLSSLSLSASAHAPSGNRANTSRNVDYRDGAAHHLAGLVDRWPEALATLKETLFFPDFEAGEVAKVREDLLTEIRTLTENNLEWIKQEMYVRAFAGHPYGRPTIGSEETVGALTAEDLQRFHAAHWTADRAVVSLVGDVEPDQVADWIASHWSDMPARRAGALERVPLPAWKPNPDRQVLPLGKEQWTVNWGRPGVPVDHPDHAASIVLGRMAGNDHFYKYVYAEGVSYRSWINFWSHWGPGVWILENDVQRERFDAVLDMFDADLARYRTAEGFTDQELSDARRRLVNGHVLGAQSNASLAWALAVQVGNGLGIDHYLDTVPRLEAVTPETVRRLAAEVFAGDGILRLQQQ